MPNLKKIIFNVNNFFFGTPYNFRNKRFMLDRLKMTYSKMLQKKFRVYTSFRFPKKEQIIISVSHEH